MRLALTAPLLLTTALALAGCGGNGHNATRASSPAGGSSGRGHAGRVNRHGVAPLASQAPGARTARAAARTFLKGWLLYEYGHANAAVMKDATPPFATVLADYPPDIPPTASSRHLYGRLVSLALESRGSSWQGLAHITDGQESFEEIVQLIQNNGRWLVDLIIPPNQ